MVDLDRFLRKLLPAVIRENRLLKFGLAIGLVVVLIGGVGAVTYVETTDHLESAAESDYTAIAELGATEISAWRGDRMTYTSKVADSYTLLQGGTSAQQYLNDKLETAPDDVVALHYVRGQDKAIVASTTTSMEGTTYNPGWLKRGAHLQDAVAVSVPHHRNGQRRVAFVTAAGSSHMLVVETHFKPVLERIQTPTDGSFLTIVGESGQVHAADRADVVSSEYQSEATWSEISSGFDGETGFVANSKDDIVEGDYLIAYTPVPNTNWVLTINVPESEAYALSGTVARYLLLIVAISIVGLGALGVGLVRPTIRELDRLGDQAQELEQGNLDVDLDTDHEDEIGRLYASFGTMRDSLRERIAESERERERAREAKAESEAFAERLETRAGAFGDTMGRCADGDLTARLSVEPDDPDALREVADSFNEAMAELEATVAEVDAFAGEVAAASESVTTSAAQAADAGEETSAAVDEISAGAEEQSEQLADVAGEMEDMSATIEEVAASADQVADTSRTAASLSKEGQAETSEAVTELHDIETRSESAAGTVRALESEMEEIGTIVDAITDIAEQTNILALNASIEAARAGEAGSGFEVVAEEVKSLAEETRDSAGEVEGLIADLREQTDETVTEMTAIRDGVAEGVETVENAEQTLETITERVEEADDGVQEISGAMDAQATSVNDVTGAVDDLAGISQQTTEEASTVAASAEEQATTLSDVSEQSRDLSDRADELQSLVDEFDVEADPDGSEGGDGAGGDAESPDDGTDASGGTTALDGTDDSNRYAVGDGGSSEFDWADGKE